MQLIQIRGWNYKDCAVCLLYMTHASSECEESPPGEDMHAEVPYSDYIYMLE